MFFPETLRCQPKWLILLEALVLVGLIGWFDYATGWEWSFFAPYAVPIVLVVWKTSRRVGLAFALFCALTWWGAHIGSNPYRTGWGFAVAVVAWLFYFAVLVVAAAAVKAHQELDRARIQTLERTEELERQILRTSEREQQRIGRDLHDSLSPHLAAIRYAASFLVSMAFADSESGVCSPG
jgi:signal transduction histidine kinase